MAEVAVLGADPIDFLKAETWSPPFSKVIVVTTGTYVSDALRWIDNHNSRYEERSKI
jgi:hypothetical protein